MESLHTTTRTRTIKPSARLRQSPDPPRYRQPSSPSTFPIFPPPHVALHPDDAASKVLHAIGRSFLSVDNKAMTIKDLSEMTMTMGYTCQNVSAASQAITTYIRAHISRCEMQQDQPLLLKHTLSGTPADDQLLPALHSRSGGAHIELPPSASTEPRTTNFRRGTVVWYLSRVTGAPCPFARAGIRLCDFVELNSIPTAYKKRKEMEQCGEKRKRRSARECVLKQQPAPETARVPARSSSPLSSLSSSDYDESDESSSELDQPPPAKIKLTLKLPPLVRVKNQPRQEESGRLLHTPATDHTPPPAHLAPSPLYRRSPSVPYSVVSVASPPPDSEDDESVINSPVSSTGKQLDVSMDVDELDTAAPDEPIPDSYDDEDDDDALFSDDWEEDDEEQSTTWESPGPRSPSAQPPAIKVKEEPRDVQGILDQWEDVLDVKDPLVKVEDPYNSGWDWEWEASYGSTMLPSSSPSNNSSTSMSPTQPRIKQEDDFDLTLSFSGSDFTAWRQPNPLSLSPTTPFGFTFGDDPMSPGAFPVSPTSPATDYPSVRPRARTVPSTFFGGSLAGQVPETPSRQPDTIVTHSLSSLVHSLSMDSPTVPYAPQALFGPDLSRSLPSVFSESEDDTDESEPRTARELPTPCVSPNDIRIGQEEPIVVTTDEPCVPMICATHIEGIAVYQSSLGPYTLLRRIDSDFVNLTPIMKYAQTPQPIFGGIPGATMVERGREEVRGLWVPLEAVRLYVKDHCLTTRASVSPNPAASLDIFLSDALVERFPIALRRFVWNSRDNLAKAPLTRQFGKNFGSLAYDEAVRDRPPSPQSVPNPTLIAAAAARDRMDVEQDVSPPPTLAMGISMSAPHSLDVPLSATEEEIFDELCVNLEGEQDTDMTVKDGLLATALTLRTPERLKGHGRARRSPSLPSSPLSSCPPSPVVAHPQLPTPSAPSNPSPTLAPSVLSPAPQVEAPATPKPSASLRRSKRVANAIAKPGVTTRSRKRGSSNLL